MKERQPCVDWCAAVRTGDAGQLEEPKKPSRLALSVVLLDQITDETRPRWPVEEEYFRQEDVALNTNLVDLLAPLAGRLVRELRDEAQIPAFFGQAGRGVEAE